MLALLAMSYGLVEKASPMSTISTHRASYQHDFKGPGHRRKKPCTAKEAELLLSIAQQATRMTEATTTAAYTMRKQRLIEDIRSYISKY